MLIFTDRNFNTVALVGSKDIPLLDDELNENIETGTAILHATLPKKHKDISRIEVGNYVFATDYKKEIVALEVMEITETRDTKDVVAEDAGLDLLNDEADPISMQGTLDEFILETLGSTSSWNIGLIEIDSNKKMTLEYKEIATQTKRISQIAGRFGAEVSYSFEFQGNTVAKKLINFHKKRGKDSGQRIEIGKELEDVRRHISITDLCTAVRPIGKDTQKVIKTVVPWNLLNSSNRESITKNYMVGSWALAEPIKSGEEVTITFKGVIGIDQRFAVYNSGGNHRIGFLEPHDEEGIYTGRFTWSIGNEGNTHLWAYQFPDKGADNPAVKIEWAVITREIPVATKHIPSKPDTAAASNPTPEPTTAAGTPTQTQTVYNTDTKIEKLIAWYESRIGKSGYDQNRRQGPYYYDCSSGLGYAAMHAGLVPKDFGIPATGKLWTYGHQGKYFYQISKSEVRRGDLFVSRSALSASSGTGHTGVFLDNHKNIIHVSASGRQRGAFKSPATASWLGPGVRYFRWNELKDNPNPKSAPTENTAVGSYWTNSTIIYHDLGKTLQGITAAQLNNWVKAKVPSSPFVGQGEVFIEAQKRSGLDARYILAHAAHESDWGRHRFGRVDHNYFGIGAYDNNPENARKYGSKSLSAGIIWGAEWIAKNYYNSKYRQTTLFKMRHNGGVHQYATDPGWHTKIANIMKQSELYTKKASVVSTSAAPTAQVSGQLVSVPDVKYEDKTVDVATTLIGYQYDDGRYVVNPAGEICDKEGLEKWGRFKGVGTETAGYILRVYESEAQTPKALFQEGLRFLQNNNEPKVNYEIDLSHLPDGIELGDTVRIVDHEFQPPLYLDARVIDITISSTDRKMNKAIFSNFVERGSGILDRIMALQDMAKSFKWDWDSQPYDMHISSSSGNVFKDGIISTDLIANVTKAGVDQTSMVDSFIWERISEYPDKVKISDEIWNEMRSSSAGNVLQLTNDDVDLQATFTCSVIKDDVVVVSAAYTIKDLTIGIFTQETEPDRSLLSWGDIWKWDDGTSPFKRVWKGDRWEDTVTKRDLELLELTPGPPGADGKDGLPGAPGADGKTSYTHFAYADSLDGVVGFTTTTTPGKKYIGMYVDFTEADSNNPSDYAWSQFRGEDGQDGTDGIPGKAGVDGKTPYFHQAWANSPDGLKDFSTTISTEKVYIGTYVDFIQADSTDPASYKWIRVRGNDGEQGPTGADGKTGQLGSNLLEKSNIPIFDNTAYFTGQWEISESLKHGEIVTVTFKGIIPDGKTATLYNTGEMIYLVEVQKQETGLYSATFAWREYDSDPTQTTENNLLTMYQRPNIVTGNPPVTIDWIVLQRGDIPAVDWVPNYNEVNDAIDSKVGDVSTKVEELQVHLQQFPPAEMLGKTNDEIAKIQREIELQKGYLQSLDNAIQSQALSLSERVAIVEIILGAGKLSMEAITTYFDFGEEGIIVGKKGEQVKMNIVNDALVFIDGTKEVVRIANNYAYIPNLRVEGLFEFAFHMATEAIDPHGMDVTVFRPAKGGDSL